MMRSGRGVGSKRPVQDWVLWGNIAATCGFGWDLNFKMKFCLKNQTRILRNVNCCKKFEPEMQTL